MCINIASTSLVHAGPPVFITFKNNNKGSGATYTIITDNDASTYTNAYPKPAKIVPKESTNSYAVTSPINSDMNYATVHYKIGNKECVFSTSFVNTLLNNKVKGPVWNKNATPTNGAICTAIITSFNLDTYSWTVDFTMG